MNALKTIFLLTLLALLANCSCSKNSTEPPPTSLTLTAEPGVIETWLTVKAENAQPGQEVALLRNGTERIRLALSLSKGAVAETTVVDTGLLPAHSYTYTAELWNNGKRLAQSDPATAATLDTTSHNFTWETFEFGGVHGSSVLYDVAIINENDIWAVGEIHTAETDTFDSLGNWVNPYNAVHWDGQEWELRRIPFIGLCSAVDYPPLRTVWAFSEQAIYFSNGGSIVYFDGSDFNMDCGMNPLLDGAITKIWGTDSTNLYVVGGTGTIVHYDGQRWQRIYTGTELPIQDIWGAYQSKEDKYRVFAVASDNSDQKLLEIVNQIGVKDRFLNVYNRLKSLWFLSPRKIFLCGGGVHIQIGRGWERVFGIPRIFTRAIRGRQLNDLWVVGDFGVALHYNGMTWRQFPELWLNNGNYEGLAVQENHWVAVGWQASKAVIVRITR